MTIKYILAASIISMLTLLSGCQSFQFVDSPIPVTASYGNHELLKPSSKQA